MAVDSPIPTRERPVPRAIVPVLALCGIGVALMQTLIVPLLPQLPVLLDATPENTSWAVTATLLAGAVITPISGRLGDMFGKRRMLTVSLGMMVLAPPCVPCRPPWYPSWSAVPSRRRCRRDSPRHRDSARRTSTTEDPGACDAQRHTRGRRCDRSAVRSVRRATDQLAHAVRGIRDHRRHRHRCSAVFRPRVATTQSGPIRFRRRDTAVDRAGAPPSPGQQGQRVGLDESRRRSECSSARPWCSSGGVCTSCVGLVPSSISGFPRDVRCS